MNICTYITSNIQLTGGIRIVNSFTGDALIYDGTLNKFIASIAPDGRMFAVRSFIGPPGIVPLEALVDEVKRVILKYKLKLTDVD